MSSEEEKTERPKSSSCGKIILRFLFSHLGLFLLVCFYSILGSWLFVCIEEDFETERMKERKIRSVDVNDSLSYLNALFFYWRDKNLTWPEWEKQVYSELSNLNNFIVSVVEDFNYDGTMNEEEWDREWTLGNALLYSVTILTTIGYGQVVPYTQMGKIATIMYALIGIPLTLVFLANIGEVMASVFRYSYSRLCCRWCRGQRRRSEYTREMIYSMGGRLPPLSKDDVGKEDYMPTAKIVVPIMLNLLLISVFILLGAVFFSQAEEWDMLSSGYFTFVTLTTIGFGDYYPGRAFSGYKGSITKTISLMGTCFYMMLGMALVSMCINLMQEQLIEKMKWFGREIGLIKDTDIEETQCDTDEPGTSVVGSNSKIDDH